MSIAFNCDWCGRPIDRSLPYSTLTSELDGKKKLAPFGTGYLGHYHAGFDDPDDCFTKLWDAIKLAHSSAQSLTALPVVSNRDVIRMRRGLKRPVSAAVTLDLGPLAAVASVVGAKAAEGADLLEIAPDVDRTVVRYLQDLAGGARALVGELPASVRGDLATHVERLSGALAQAQPVT